jgi:outer membrane protein assembly factor BamE (lipoprotein component of BamABCDE complex)
MKFYKVLFCFLVTFLFIGCTYGKLQRLDIEGNEIQRQWLDAMENGKTMREEVLLKFGIPSAQFEGERILTYRMVLEKKKKNQTSYRVRGKKKPSSKKEVDLKEDISSEDRLMVVSRELDPRQVYTLWRIAQYDLVLVFGESGVLEKHSLIKVR